MPTQATIISKATIAARKDWYNFTIVQENEIIKLYEKARDSLLEQIRKSTKDNVIMKARRKSLLAEINSDLNTLRVSLNSKIRMGMRNSIDLGIKSGIWSMNAIDLKNTNVGTSWVGVDNLIRRYDASRTLYANSMWGKINRETMDFLLRYRPGGMEFSDSIWDSTWGVQKQMRNMVNQAVLLGDSSQRLANQLTKYLSKEGIKTGPGIYKSAYSNAWRLARTEMNRGYTEGQIRYAATKDFIDGFIWRTGGNEPCDICAELDGQFFPKDAVPEIPHPNCMCWREWHIADQEMENAA